MRLYRAVSSIELNDIRSHNGFRDSHHQTGEKGFFFERADAARIASWASRYDGLQYSIVETDAPEAVIRRGRPHPVLHEGPGVYLLASDLNQLSPALEV